MDSENVKMLEKSLAATSINRQKNAIQLPVATRGVGIIAAHEYKRMCFISKYCTNSSDDSSDDSYDGDNSMALEKICTIYQYYRICLYLAYYKLNLANVLNLNIDISQSLSWVNRVPRGMYYLLESIGRIKGSVNEWHSITIESKAIHGEEAALYLYPFNIREYLINLSDPNFNSQYRNRFHELNPLPGAKWYNDPINGWILQNADVIWPADYEATYFEEDLRAFNMALSHVEFREREFLIPFSWNRMARITGTVSMNPCSIRLEAKFQLPPDKQNKNSKRNVHRRPTDVMVYQSDIIDRSINDQVWSPEVRISGLDLQIGAGTMVGENFSTPTRLQINGSVTTFLYVNPLL